MFSCSIQFDMAVVTLWLVITPCNWIICPRTFQTFYWSEIIWNQLPVSRSHVAQNHFSQIHCCEFLNTRKIMGNRLLDYLKVKQSHYRPGEALSVSGGWGSQISRQLAHEGGKVASPRHRPPLPPGNIPGTHFC